MSRLIFGPRYSLWLALAVGLSSAQGGLAAQPLSPGLIKVQGGTPNSSTQYSTSQQAPSSLQNSAQQPNPEALKLAVKAAEQFLASMDQRDYAKAWDQSAKHFKASVDKDVWVRLAGAAREPLGEIKARRTGLSRAAKDLPKGPVGDYIIINFETDISIEPITEMMIMYREDAQHWRCIGYFVRPR